MSANSPVALGTRFGDANLGSKRLLVWLPIAVGFVVLYLPSLVDLFRGIWSTDQHAHGPIVLGIACWLMYRKWPGMLQASAGQAGSSAGWPIFLIGLLLYVLGRSQDILIFEIGSIIWLLAAILLLTYGTAALRAQWFPL